MNDITFCDQNYHVYRYRNGPQLQLNDKLEKSVQVGVTLHIKNILLGEETSSKCQDTMVILAK